MECMFEGAMQSRCTVDVGDGRIEGEGEGGMSSQGDQPRPRPVSLVAGRDGRRWRRNADVRADAVD